MKPVFWKIAKSLVLVAAFSPFSGIGQTNNLNNALDSSDSNRPSEESLFGDSSATGTVESSGQQEPKNRPTEDSLFSSEEEKSSAPIWESLSEDPLKIGGIFYMRAQSGADTKNPPSGWSLSVPTLVDGYFDARPNERIRGFLLTRLKYDPTIAETSSPENGPLSLALDQLWLRFDLLRSVFVTFGKQHIKWGTGRFWNPTDFLHPVSRDPLASMDTRSGVTMLKLHFPWEKYGWNFYAVGILEDLGPSNTIGKVGGAIRGEIVVGQAEIGLDLVAQKGHKPKIGMDISSGLGPVDIYAEIALTREAEKWRASNVAENSYEKYQPRGTSTQLVAGLDWSLDYLTHNLLTFGMEYFYNSLGYDGKEIYSELWNNNVYRPFYLGKHYACIYGTFSGPASLYNLKVIISNLANISDKSYVSRLQGSVTILTHLEVEAFTAFHYGNKGGEFRFALDSKPTENSPGVHISPQLMELGVGFKVRI